MTPSPASRTRQAQNADYDALAYFLGHTWRCHHHLDWRASESWVHSGFCYLYERKSTLTAALAIPLLPVEPAWVRLFACAEEISPKQAWKMLFPPLRETLLAAGKPPLCAVPVRPWSIEFFTSAGFRHHQDIVLFELNQPIPPDPTAREVSITPMTVEDVQTVAALDQASFEPIWRNNEDSVLQALLFSSYATVARLGKDTVGFQISTLSETSAHLARLAVTPDRQNSGIGAALVRDLSAHFFNQGKSLLTVNTQSDNLKSQALYERLGFERTGSSYPVFIMEDY